MPRAATASDEEFITHLAVRVFSHLGDYGRIMPTWLAHRGVRAYIVDRDGRAAGFAMIGYYRDEELYVADLLAIAVESAAQHLGLGRRLLMHTIAAARAARKTMPVAELRLSVAEPNLRARKLFEKAGFVVVPGDHGQYDNGQRALHLRLPFED